MLQLVSSLVVFTHSINNFHIVSKIETTNGSSIRNTINKFIRDNFAKLSGHTTELNAANNSSNDGDIMRIVNEIPHTEVLLNLHKTYTHLKPISYAVGEVLLPKIITAAGVINMEYLIGELGTKFVEHIMNPRSILDILQTMLKYLCERAFHFLLRLAKCFIEEFIDKTEKNLNTFISSESVLYRMLIHCFSQYKIFTYEYLEKNTLAILNDLEGYFNSLNPVGDKSDRRNCKVCGGHYYRCAL